MTKSKFQVSPSFSRYINLGYQMSSDPLTKHRALHLQHLSTDLSGRYACRISSVFQEDFKSKDLVIYGQSFSKL